MLPSLDTYAAANTIERSLTLARAERIALLHKAARPDTTHRHAVLGPLVTQRRRATASALVAILSVALVLGVLAFTAGAHEAGTPATGSGVTTEVLGSASPAQAPGQSLFLLRVTFAPGSGVVAHTHPGATIYSVVSGTLEFMLQSGAAQVVHGAATTEAMPIGEAFTLTAGDTVVYDGTAVQTERNTSDAPAVVIVSNLRGSDEPARRFVEATPTGS
jgi:quercetin dioxygenase-like cupin family protein